MDKILVFGHKKPDTDSVCGAISLAYLKKQMGLNAEARILSELSPETIFALNKFNVSEPRYLNDVKIQLKDVKYKKNYFVNEKDSIYSTYNYLTKRSVTGIPLVDDNKKFKGYVSLKEIASNLVYSDSNYLNTTYDNIVETLNGKSLCKFDDVIEGNAIAAALKHQEFISTIKIDKSTILIVGNREHVINYALESGAKLIIIINNHELDEGQIKLAYKNKVNVIVTPYDTFKTSRILTLANPISNIKRSSSAICFDPNDYLSDFLEVSNRLKHTNYPIVNKKGVCEGILRVIDTHDYTKKKVILVDHNEPTQSVDGLDEAELLEIVDHHNIGDISTMLPINFRNMAVGSVNTIIYTLYEEQAIKIPKDIAGLMLSGILSDTLLLASPTTTELDRKVATILAKKARVNLKEYGMELLESGVSIDGLSISDVIYRDFKNYVINDNKFAVGQVFTTNFNNYLPNINDYVKELDLICDRNDYKLACLFVTDILSNNSYVLFNTKGSTYVTAAFKVTDAIEGMMLKGVISRKKQMIPPIMEVLEKA